VDFFDEDEDDLDQPRRRGGGRPPGAGGGATHAPPTRQQARARQVAFLVGAVVVLILLVLAFRGCLNARSERSFQNYVSDLSSITTETDQLSDSFFQRLGGKTEVDDVTFQTEVDGDKGTAQGLLDRAAGLDAPDEVAVAQEQIELAYELRRDALDGIASQVGAAQAEKGKNDATNVIYTQMKVLSASDILFARARAQIEQELEDEEIVVEEGVPSSQFLPTEPDYLDQSVTDGAVSVIAGSGSGGAGPNCDPGDNASHGLGLISVTLIPSGTVLTEDADTAAVDGDQEVEVEVENQGEANEGDISVDVSGGGIEGNQVINQIAAGETQTVSIPLQPAPQAGETVDLEVSVATVCGEQIADNNEGVFPVTF